MALTKPEPLVPRLVAIADALREATGDNKKYTLAEMAEIAKDLEEETSSYILVDADGNEYGAVMVDEKVEITATAEDVREGVTFVSDDGVDVGEKYIPSYYATESVTLIPAGSSYSIKLADNDLYDYTKFQAIICPFQNEIQDSVKCEKIVIDDKVYDALSTTVVSELTKDSNNKTIELGLINTAETPYLIRYFTYKEVY